MEAQPPLTGKKIIVLGAGIAGLSFIISLRKQWPADLSFPEVVLYERDGKETSIGREGYSISIRGDTYSGGLQTLEAMGLLEKASVAAVSQTSSETPGGFAFWDPQWRKVLDVGHHPGMRIARDSLRRILVDAALDVEGVSVRWGTAFTDIQVSNDKVTVTLANGTVDTADIVIAADGANSKARAQLRPEDTLSFAGAVSLSATARFPDGNVPTPMDRNWGFAVPGDGTALFVSPISSTAALWSLSYLSDTPREDTKRPYTAEQIEGFLNEALHRGKALTEPFQTLVKSTDPSTLMVLNALDKQPFPHTEQEIQQNLIIFIGDSNHAVSPFSGNGANMALLDGWELAVQLSKAQTLQAALKEYDESSIPRCREAVRFSRRAIDMVHATRWKMFFYRFGMRVASLLLWLKG